VREDARTLLFIYFQILFCGEEEEEERRKKASEK